ncbi:MAG: hypothetical protein JSS81_17540 [Acidobacteria bacterium]|nr:hypothetical protein [Acidobacteriota bacterium]
MKNQNVFKNIIVFTLIITMFGIVSAAARTKDAANAGARLDRLKTALVERLTERLRADLTDQTVEIRLRAVENGAASKNRIDFTGDALAVVRDDKTALPFQFTARVNAVDRSVESIDYKFVESATDFAAAETEDNLSRELMNALGREFKTTNIVMSIDGFDAAAQANGETAYDGTGEVRIGDVEWRRIKFSVRFDAATQTATSVTYELQK